MLTPYKPQFIEQIYTDHAGQQFRLVFVVSVVDGKLKGRLVSAVPVAAHFEAKTVPVCLPVSLSHTTVVTEYITPLDPFVSPYFSLDFLINSQPTRAPSYK